MWTVQLVGAHCTTGERRMKEPSLVLHCKEMENAAVAGTLHSGVGLKELTLEDVGSLGEPNLEDGGSL